MNQPEKEMLKDRYAEFADRYDRFFDAFGKYGTDEAQFFRDLKDRFKLRTILDCACGTGRHLPLFVSLGLQVTASDYSLPC